MSAMLGLICLVLLVTVGVFNDIQSRRWLREFHAEIIREGRTIAWDELRGRLERGEGTIIVNETNLPGKVWWTPITPLPGSPIEGLVHLALETQCPKHLASRISLEKAFPAVNLVEARGSIALMRELL